MNSLLLRSRVYFHTDLIASNLVYNSCYCSGRVYLRSWAHYSDCSNCNNLSELKVCDCPRRHLCLWRPHLCLQTSGWKPSFKENTGGELVFANAMIRLMSGAAGNLMNQWVEGRWFHPCCKLSKSQNPQWGCRLCRICRQVDRLFLGCLMLN